MKLWKLERTGLIGWDEYIGDVVAAETKDRALELSQVGRDNPEVTLIGIAEKTISEGVVMDSFNAG